MLWILRGIKVVMYRGGSAILNLSPAWTKAQRLPLAVYSNKLDPEIVTKEARQLKMLGKCIVLEILLSLASLPVPAPLKGAPAFNREAPTPASLVYNLTSFCQTLSRTSPPAPPPYNCPLAPLIFN